MCRLPTLILTTHIQGEIIRLPSVVMDSDEKNRFNSFLTNLFAISVPGMNVDGHLWPLAYLLIATFLKDMDHMITAFGDNHIVMKKVYDAVKSNGWCRDRYPNGRYPNGLTL